MLHCDIVFMAVEFPLLMAWYCWFALAERLCNVQDDLVCVSAGRLRGVCSPGQCRV